MAKKSSKKTAKPVRPQLGEGVEILNAGSVLEDPITSTLETNYMPYAMSVIVSRALPEIDGFKPEMCIRDRDHTYFAYTEPEKAAFLKEIGDKKYTIPVSYTHLDVSKRQPQRPQLF